MRRQLLPSILMLLVMTVVTGFAYTLTVTGVGQLLFGERAGGSLLERDGQPVGSELIGQSITSPEFFHPRPSAAGDGYDPTISSGSNLGPQNPDLLASVEERIAAYRELNGLGPRRVGPRRCGHRLGLRSRSPHIRGERSPTSPSDSWGRGISEDEVMALIDENTVNPMFGFLNEPAVNVLMLNIALEERETSS